MEVQLTDEEILDVDARLQEHRDSHGISIESSYICDEDCWRIALGIIINDVLRDKMRSSTVWVPIERQRMNKGKCPKCGFIPAAHIPKFEAWIQNCPYSDIEVVALLDQYQRELTTEDGRRAESSELSR